MPAPSIFGPRDEALADPRSLLSSIGEVAYSWDIASDGLKWGPNVQDVLGALPSAVTNRGFAFAALVSPYFARCLFSVSFHSEESQPCFSRRWRAG